MSCSCSKFPIHAAQIIPQLPLLEHIYLLIFTHIIIFLEFKFSFDMIIHHLHFFLYRYEWEKKKSNWSEQTKCYALKIY